MSLSLNDFLLVSAYQPGQGLKQEIKNGFAYTKQRIDIVGLALIIDAKLKDGTFIPAGSTIYVDEELLTTSPWAKKIKRCEALGNQEFIVLEARNAIFIDIPETSS